MSNKYSHDEIVSTLRRIDELTASGLTVPQACRRVGLPELTYLRWLHKYGDATAPVLERIERLEAENERLRRIVAEQASHILELASH